MEIVGPPQTVRKPPKAIAAEQEAKPFAIRISLLLYFSFMLIVQYMLLEHLQTILFPAYVAWASVVLLFNIPVLLCPETIEKNRLLYLIMGGTLLYQCTIGLQYHDQDSLQYCGLRILTLTILVLAVARDYEFVLHKFYPLFGGTILILSVIGGLMLPVEVRGRFLLGWGNPTSTGAAAALAFIIFLFTPLPWRLHWLGRIAGLACLLLSGSRGGLLMAFIGLLFWKKNMWKNCLILVLALLVMQFIIDEAHLEFAGWTRLFDTFAQHEMLNRDVELQAAWYMIKERWLTGWGLSSYRYVAGAATQFTDLGSHNGFLTLIKMYGLVFGGVFIFAILRFFLGNLWNFSKIADPVRRLPFAICLGIMGGALAEDYLVGVNQFVTGCFFLSCGMCITQYQSMRISAQKFKMET